MRFWKIFVPDEPLVQSTVVPARNVRGKLPRAVRNWSVLSILMNGLIAGIVTAVIRNAAPILIAALCSLFPAYLMLFWNDAVSATDTARDRAIQQSPFLVQIPLGMQWIAVSICLTTT